jgi:hypothetical protein
MIHQRLKTLDVLRLDLDEMVELQWQATGLAATYEQQSLEVPEWLIDATRTLRRAIRQKRDDQLALRLQEARDRLKKLRSPEERRGDLETQIAALEAQLHETPA